MKTSVQALRKIAMRHPETSEGIACAGTSLESRTIKAGSKAFLFLRATEIRLKLEESLAEAKRIAKKDPKRFQVGAGGWVKAVLSDGGPPLELLKRWIDESYRLMAGTKKRTSK